MNLSSRRRTNRWLGVATSFMILGLIAAVIGLQSTRVRGHIPYLNRPAPTATPAGVVLSLGQQLAVPIAGTASVVVLLVVLVVVGATATSVDTPPDALSDATVVTDGDSLTAATYETGKRPHCA